MCEVIEGTSTQQIAKVLGLEAQFSGTRAHQANWEREDEAGFVPRNSLPDEERFRGAEPLLVRCLRCGTEGTFAGPLVPSPPPAIKTLRSGLFCSRDGCGGLWGPREGPQPVRALESKVEREVSEKRLSNAVVVIMRRFAATYHSGWMVCEDALCSTRTRSQGSYAVKSGLACTRPGCSSNLRFETETASVHNQLEYLASLFDYARADSRARKRADKLEVVVPIKATSKQGSPEFPATHALIFDKLHGEVQRVLQQSAFHYVQTGPLFEYVKRMNAARGIETRPLRFPTGMSSSPAPGFGAFATPDFRRRGGSSLLSLGANFGATDGVSSGGASAKFRKLAGGGKPKTGFMAVVEET